MRPLYSRAMRGCLRIARTLGGLALLGLGAGSAGADADRRPAVYDVTAAGLACCHGADVRPMTAATITRHVDGDTFEVAIADPPHGTRTAELVRLMGIDAPELDADDPLAAEALDHVVRAVGERPVHLAFDFRRRDRYDRLLAFVYLPDGTLLNAELLETGLAVVYRGDDLMYFLAPFEDLEREARSRELGVWRGKGAAGVIIVDIRNQSRAEHVLLRNDGSAAVDISGWRICDDDGDVLMIPSRVMLARGETLAVGSGTGCADTHHPCLPVSTKNVWGNTGDVACLKDRSGNVVDARAYGNQAGDTCPF